MSSNYQGEQLDALFRPRTIAVIGATEREGSFGAVLVRNLTGCSFAGTIYLVNPNRRTVANLATYPTIADVPAEIDLALIAVRAQMVPTVIGQCTAVGAKAAIVLSAGFRESGAAGSALEQRILESAQPHDGDTTGESAPALIAAPQRRVLRVVGPSSLGLMRPSLSLNATFVPTMVRPGKVAFISQSGALGAAILDWSQGENIGFSAFISAGSMLDVGWGELITWLGDDPLTQTIILYVEAIDDPRSFLSAAREVTLRKPIIAIKAGRSVAAALAAASHTGSMAGRDEVIDAAFRRCGVTRVDTIAELFYMADVLDKQPRPRGPRLGIVSNAGGPGVLATDALLAAGGKLAELTPTTVAALDNLLPPNWSRRNPVDLLDDAGPDRFEAGLEIVSKDPNTDGLLVILTPHGITDPTRTAERLRRFARLDGKPLLASWMGGPEVEAGAALLNQANIPVFNYPDTAARMFNHMWRYSDNLRGIYETPILRTAHSAVSRSRTDARRVGRWRVADFE
jgi:acetyltransferase